MSTQNIPFYELLGNWRSAATAMGIPENAYHPTMKIVRDKHSSFSFGVYLNEYRFARFDKIIGDCTLCDAIALAREEPQRMIFPENELPGFIITPNAFPLIEGASIAITTSDKPMYTTLQTAGVAEELRTVLDFCAEKGFRAYHNCEGFGATLPHHEHWHLTTFPQLYAQSNGPFGFDGCTREEVKNTGTWILPDYPFSHILFDEKNTGRIELFIERLGKEYGHHFASEEVPHVLCQGEHGILLVVANRYVHRGLGSGDAAGHFVCKTREEFEKANFEYCMTRLQDQLALPKDIDLTKLL